MGGALAFIGAVGAITTAVVKSFGGVQDQVRAAQEKLTADLDRQADALRAELADVNRRSERALAEHERELADCCARCARCEKKLAELEHQVAGVKRRKT